MPVKSVEGPYELPDSLRGGTNGERVRARSENGRSSYSKSL